MKLVSIEVRAARDGEVVVATIVEQRNRGGGWEEVERHVVRSGEPGSQRTLLLEENERIIVDGRTQKELVMDREQNVVREVSGSVLADVPVAMAAGPLPDGEECQVGVWREAGEQDWSRTGKRYRTY